MGGKREGTVIAAGGFLGPTAPAACWFLALPGIFVAPNGACMRHGLFIVF